MARFGLIVHFDIAPQAMDRFLALVRVNAESSVRDEPGCQRFDVLVDPAREGRVTLYEIYDDESAFAAHMKMPHVAAFFTEAKPLIRAQENSRLELVDAPTK